MSKLSNAYTHYATARMLHRRISRIQKRVWQDADIREASLQRTLRARREYYSLLASLGASEVARWRWRQAREYRAAVNSEHNRRERAAQSFLKANLLTLTSSSPTCHDPWRIFSKAVTHLSKDK